MAITKVSNSGVNGSKYDIVSADNYYMEPIATTLVGSGGVASISFTNIPQGYKHLQVRGLARVSSNATGVYFVLNSDSSANYTLHRLVGDGSSATAGGFTGQTSFIASGAAGSSTYTTGVFGASVTDILDYANLNKYKTIRSLTGVDNNGAGAIRLNSSLWLNTSAITSITITPDSPLFAEYTRFSLYGIKG